MMATRIETDALSVLRHLVDTCRDREDRYRAAQEDTDDPALKALCAQYARQSAELRRELEGAVRRYGVEPGATRSSAGAVFRSWKTLRAAMDNDDDAALLSECEREEELAARQYRLALQSCLAPELASLVSRQAEDLGAAHRSVQTVRRRAHTSPSL
jgi:uncharacterized protein (TIGR02284 family)